MGVPSLLLLLSCALSVVYGAGLVDYPILTGVQPQILDGTWNLKSLTGTSINGQVPGDIITDLFNAGQIPDPYYEINWISNSSVWTGTNWTYSTTFTYSNQGEKETLLVFDGVKMGAEIFLNGESLGVVNDQFLRYNFSVQSLLIASNTLQVTFPNNYSIDTSGRFMACTGGWDWAPYSQQQSYGANAFTQGIWKSVYLAFISTTAIVHVVPQIKYTGNYPTAPLVDDRSTPFEVTVNVHFTAPASVSGALTISGSWGESNTSTITIPAGDSITSITIPASSVYLWWPVGLGQQYLYDLDVVFAPTGSQQLTTSRQIGFRVFSLVTVNDTDPTPYVGGNGSGNFTMRYKVNGANVYSRGGNMIPLEEFEGRANIDAYTYLMKSVIDGGLNTLRIWGGGIFQYDIFYDLCDQLGILVYHDMMYAQNGHSPSDTPTQDAEIRYQVRRLSHHPSIIMWDGCNECGGGGIYAQFVITVVASEDQSRVIWPSSPGYGWASGVDTLYGNPNGQPLVSRTSGHTYETHGPYQHGSGYPAVNGDPDINQDLFDPNLPPSLNTPAPTGPDQEGVFASEFGCVAMSSFESMSVYLSPEHWTLHTSVMSQRNYPCDNIILEYFGSQNNSEVGLTQFQRQLYQCMLGQALEMKSNIENRRSGNEFGTVIWQLGEIWPTGGWGSLEYATPEKGQVLGGRWKPLHYFLKGSLFQDVISTCGTNAECYVKNDGIIPFSGVVVISTLNLVNGQVKVLLTQSVDLPAGAGAMQWFCLQGNPGSCSSYSSVLSSVGCSQNSCVLQISTISNNKTILSGHTLALAPPTNLTLTKGVSVSVTQVTPNAQGGATITVSTTGGVAAYVVFTSLANGRFSDNAIFLIPGSTSIDFLPFGPLDIQLLTSSLRIEFVQSYL